MLQGSFSWSLNSSQEEPDSSCPPFLFTVELSCFPSSGLGLIASSPPCLKTASQPHLIPHSWLSLSLKTSINQVPFNPF